MRLVALAHTAMILFAGLAAAAPAHADVPPTYLSPSIAHFAALDDQFTHFSVSVACPSDPSLPTSDCPVGVALSWRAAGRTTYRPEGRSIALAAATVTVPAGTTTTLTLIAPKTKLRNVTARRHVAAVAYATLTDLRTGGRVDQQQYLGAVGAYDSCPGPAYVPFGGGSVVVLDRSTSGKVTRSPVLSGDLGVGDDMQVGAAPVHFTILGVTYRLSAHAVFARTCWGLSDYHHGRPAPTVFLGAGTVHVSGRPYGAQIWVSIGTPEGSLGSRSQERVVFTVTRNPRKQVSTMRVAVGATTQVTPFNTPTRSPCTDGQALSVDRYGHIHKL